MVSVARGGKLSLSDENPEVEKRQPASSIEHPEWPQCRACFEPIHPKASVCKSCQTHQRYPKWISSLAPGIGMLLALLSITSLLITDILSSVFPQRGSITAYITYDEDADNFQIAFANIGEEPVTIDPMIECPVILPEGFRNDHGSGLPWVVAWTFVKLGNERDEPIVLFPNERQNHRFDVQDLSIVNGNPETDALAFHNMLAGWRVWLGEDEFAQILSENELVLDDQEDFFRMLQKGPPQSLEPAWVPNVRDPYSGDNLIWKCEAEQRDQHGAIEGNPIINPYVDAAIFSTEDSFVWRLSFSNQRPMPFNPLTSEWGSSCGAGTDGGCLRGQ